MPPDDWPEVWVEIRGGGWENIGEDYVTATLDTSIDPDGFEGMGFRCAKTGVRSPTLPFHQDNFKQEAP